MRKSFKKEPLEQSLYAGIWSWTDSVRLVQPCIRLLLSVVIIACLAAVADTLTLDGPTVFLAVSVHDERSAAGSAKGNVCFAAIVSDGTGIDGRKTSQCVIGGVYDGAHHGLQRDLPTAFVKFQAERKFRQFFRKAFYDTHTTFCTGPIPLPHEIVLFRHSKIFAEVLCL